MGVQRSTEDWELSEGTRNRYCARPRAPCCGGRMTIIETFERGCNTAISPDRSNPDRQIMIAIARSRRPNADHSYRLCSIGCELIRPKTRMIPPRRRSIGLNSAEASKPLLISRGTGSLNPFSSSGESVSAVNSGAVGEKPGAFAPVCTANGTREGDELAEHLLIWPFLSEGH